MRTAFACIFVTEAPQFCKEKGLFFGIWVTKISTFCVCLSFWHLLSSLLMSMARMMNNEHDDVDNDDDSIQLTVWGGRSEPEGSPNFVEVVQNILTNLGGSISWGRELFRWVILSNGTRSEGFLFCNSRRDRNKEWILQKVRRREWTEISTRSEAVVVYCSIG